MFIMPSFKKSLIVEQFKGITLMQIRGGGGEQRYPNRLPSIFHRREIANSTCVLRRARKIKTNKLLTNNLKIPNTVL